MNKVKKFFLMFILCYGLNFNGYNQNNIVPNFSFEDTINCPTGFWGELWKEWYPSTITTTDYFHLCLSLQYNLIPPTPQ